MKRSSFPFFFATLTLCLSSSRAAAQEVVNPGFEKRQALPVSLFSQYATLANGNTFVYRSEFGSGEQNFELYAPGGALLASLGSLPVETFTSFAILDPTETYALVGESGTGDLMTVDLAGGGVTIVANLPSNYDAKFAPSGDVFVSHATVSGNDVSRLDVATWTPVAVASVSGFSGPIALNAQGDLYYAPTTPPRVIFWTAAQVAGGIRLGEADATEHATGFNGITSMQVDPASGNLVLADNDFLAGDDRIVTLDAQGTVANVVVQGQLDVTLGNLELVASGGPGTFHAFQPAGVTLKYDVTDFGLFVSRRVLVSPDRAETTLTGPTFGPAAKTLRVTGALPNAAVLVTFGLQSDVSPGVFDLGWGAPYHSMLPLNKVRRIQFHTPTDADGTAVFQYYDPGTMHGTLVFQPLVLDAAIVPLGSATHVYN